MRFLKNKNHDNQHTNPSPNNQNVKDKSKGLKRINQSVHKIALCGSAILLFLSSCNSTAIVEQAPVEEIRTLQTNKTPELSTPTKELQNTVEVTEEVPTPTMEATPTEEVEATPEKEFDESTLNLVEWPNYELVETETFEKLETVHIKEGTRIFAFPYYKEDFTETSFEEFNPSIKEFDAPKDLYFQIGEKRTIQNDKGENVTVGIVAGTLDGYTDVQVFGIILTAQDANGVVKNFLEDINPDFEDKDIITMVSISDRLQEYKFNSSLLSIYRFTKYQEENGMFLANQEYSMSDILSPFSDFEKPPYYPKDGKILQIPGSSILSSSLVALFCKNPEIGEVVLSRKGPYDNLGGPFLKEEVWDVDMNANSPFIFKLHKDGYLLINHVVLPVGEIKEPQIKGFSDDPLSGYVLFYSVSFVDSKDVLIKTSKEFIYDEESGSVSPILLDDNIKIRSHYITDNKKLKELADSLYIPISLYEIYGN